MVEKHIFFVWKVLWIWCLNSKFAGVVLSVTVSQIP